MRHVILAATALAVACVTNNPGSTAQDPPVAMFAGGSATTGTGASGTGTATNPSTPVTGEVIPSPCPFPVFRVAAGVDIAVSWYDLNEDPDGNPITPPNSETGAMTVKPLSVDAATAESLCAGSLVDVFERTIPFGLDELPEMLLPASVLPEGGATFVTLWRYNLPLAILIESTTASEIQEISLTPDDWAL